MIQKRCSKRSPWAWVPSLYFAEGIPYVVVMSIAAVMYKRFGLSNTDIALYTSWLYLPWVIKPFWSPVVDMLKTKRWWIVVMQLLVGASLAGVAFTLHTSFAIQLSLAFFWLMAFSSATHDIAADGFYMLGLDDEEQALFVGIRSTFYRIATIAGQGFLIMIAGVLEVFTRRISMAWSLTFYAAAALFLLLCVYHRFVLPCPSEDRLKRVSGRNLLRDFLDSFVTFFKKPHIIPAVLFMLLYRFPEAMLTRICPLFFIEKKSAMGLGLTTSELGFVQGTIGVIGLTIGGIVGGIAAAKGGLRKWLWPMVIAMSLPNLVYVYLSWVLPENFFMINACVFIEQFGYGFGFTAYMLFLIFFSKENNKTAHYAICTAFMAMSMMFPGIAAGWLQEKLGYAHFFEIIMLFCLITVGVSYWIKRRFETLK